MSSANPPPKSPKARWPLRVTVGREDGVTVLTLGGRIGEGSSTQFASAIGDAIAGGMCRLVIDFADVDYISSAGLDVLASASGRLREMGGELVACGVKGPVRTALQLAATTDDVEIVPARREAIQRLTPSRFE